MFHKQPKSLLRRVLKGFSASNYCIAPRLWSQISAGIMPAFRLLSRWNGGKLDIAKQMANHESARTTGLYDRRNDQVSLDEVERILI
jgi:hypothetical protein